MADLLAALVMIIFTLWPQVSTNTLDPDLYGVLDCTDHSSSETWMSKTNVSEISPPE